MLNTKMIGNKIAEGRKKVNISQAELAERLFISPQAVGKWERGESMPDITTFGRLAEILSVDLNYFSESISSAEAQSENHRTNSDKPLIEESVGSSSGKQNLPGKSGKKLSWDMSRGNWVDGDFSGLKNLHEKFSSSNMKNCKFIGSELSGLVLKSNNVEDCDFSDSVINNSLIQNSNLGTNLFKNCSLKGAEFLKNNISGCDFSGANFSDTTFKSGTLLKNTIVNAFWNNASFIDMAIDNIVFDGTFDNCSFDNCSFYKATFQNSIFINTFFKNNKNLKRVKFVNCQADRMTYEFLKNGKADLSGITVITS